MIVTHELARENGSQSSNLYVFMRFPTDGDKGAPNNEPPKQEKLNHLNKTNLEKTNIKDLNKRNDELDYTFTSDRIPNLFVHVVRAFYDQASEIEEFWRMVEIASYKYVYEQDSMLKLDIAIKAFKQTIRKVKTGLVKKPIAYFYTIALRKFRDVFHNELDEVSVLGEQGTTYAKCVSWIA